MAKKAYLGIDGVARKVKKIYVGVTDVYTVLDYIQSSGTQYIDTEFKPNNNTRVVMDAELISSTGNVALFGARVSPESNNYALAWIGSYFRSDYNSVYTQKWEVSQTTRRIYDKNKETSTIDGVSQSYTNATFQVPVNLALLANNQNGDITWFASAKLYSCQIYDNGTLVRYFVPCKNSSGDVGLYDSVNGKFYGNAGKGTFAAGTETGETISTDSFARKIKKGYIGIGGVARPCFDSGLSYYGMITPLPDALYNRATTTVGNHILFGGGNGSGTQWAFNVMYAYDLNLTQTTPTSLKVARSLHDSTTVGNYALFACGQNADATRINSVDAYDVNLTRTTPTSMSVSLQFLKGASVGNYALFGGGTSDGKNSSKVVNAYSSSLTRTIPTALNTVMDDHSATSVGDYVLFGGGEDRSTISNPPIVYLKAVNAYSSSLTRVIVSDLSKARRYAETASIGNYALFAGGTYSGNNTGYIVNIVDVYDTSLTRTTAPTLSTNGVNGSKGATTLETYALFSSVTSNVIDAYDESLTRTSNVSLTGVKTACVSGTIGNYALFSKAGYTELEAITIL